MSVTITVRGTSSALRRPERATIFLAVAMVAPDQQQVYAAAANSASVVSGRLREMFDPGRGPVTSWSSDQIRTWASRPWSNEGQHLPLVYHAHVGFQATFSDFTQLAGWLAQIVELGGVSVDRVEWSLTDASRDALTREVRAAAVRDARDKAQMYADALTLGAVRVVALADQGMLEDGAPGPVVPQPFARASMAAEAAQIDLVPEDVTVSAAVDARFEID